MELRRILMTAALVTTVGGSSLLAEPSARRSGGEGCPNYSAFPSETCVDVSERVQWCKDKLDALYGDGVCAPSATGSDHVCGSNNINCKVATP